MQEWETELLHLVEGFQPCVCHKGISWDVQDLDDNGYCPQYFWEIEDSEQEEC